MFAFLHNVLYIAIPSIKTAKAINGIKMKILVLRPIIKIRCMPIKLSQYQSTVIVNVPFVFGFCNNETITLGNRSDALSHLTAKVLGHMKSLFLITISLE